MGKSIYRRQLMKLVIYYKIAIHMIEMQRSKCHWLRWYLTRIKTLSLRNIVAQLRRRILKRSFQSTDYLNLLINFRQLASAGFNPYSRVRVHFQMPQSPTIFFKAKSREVRFTVETLKISQDFSTNKDLKQKTTVYNINSRRKHTIAQKIVSHMLHLCSNTLSPSLVMFWQKNLGQRSANSIAEAIEGINTVRDK